MLKRTHDECEPSKNNEYDITGYLPNTNIPNGPSPKTLRIHRDPNRQPGTLQGHTAGAPDFDSTVYKTPSMMREKLKMLNTAFLEAVNAEVKKEPSCSLVPLIKNYAQYTYELVSRDVIGKNHSTFYTSGDCRTSLLQAMAEFFDKVGLMASEGAKPGYSSATGIIAGGSYNNLEFCVPTHTTNSNICRFGVGTDCVDDLNENAQAQENKNLSAPSEICRKLERKPEEATSMCLDNLSNGFTAFGSATVTGNDYEESNGDSENNDANVSDEEDESKCTEEMTRKINFEPDAVYQCNCQVFEMGASKKEYRSKGVGTLFVKMLNAGNYHLIVRAENSQGTIILNSTLTCGTPIARPGTKQVMLMIPGLHNGAKKSTPVILKTASEKEGELLFEKLMFFKSLI